MHVLLPELFTQSSSVAGSCYSSAQSSACRRKRVHHIMANNESKRPKTWVHLIKGSCDLIYVNYAAIVAVNRKQSCPAIIFQYYSPPSSPALLSLLLANKRLPVTMYRPIHPSWMFTPSNIQSQKEVVEYRVGWPVRKY